MAFCIILKYKKHVYRPPKCLKKINKMACRAIFLIFTQKWPDKSKNEKNSPTSHFIIFFSVLRRSIHMFFIFEYDTKNHEVLLFNLNFSKFHHTRYPGVPQITTPRGNHPPQKNFLTIFIVVSDSLVQN